jgi:Kdo2-lipid IVA lauroyltransferase/acyltransferase
LKNRIEYILFISFSLFFRALGLYLSRRFAVIIAIIFFYIIPIRKTVTVNNIRNAFPHLDGKQVKKIAFRSYRSFAITLAEIMLLPSMTRERMMKLLKCTNLELISKKFEEGNGVILLSAHFGNWEYGANSVSLQANKKFTIIVKNLRNPLVSEWMNKMRTKWLNEVVSLGVSVRQIYNDLKEKNIVAMIADQRGPEDSIKLEFFGRKTSVLVGPAVLSLKTGAPLIFGITVRQKDYSYKMNIVEINKDDLPDENNDKIEELSRRHLYYLESVIRENPEQWLWMHNRWKH